MHTHWAGWLTYAHYKLADVLYVPVSLSPSLCHCLFAVTCMLASFSCLSTCNLMRLWAGCASPSSPYIYVIANANAHICMQQQANQILNLTDLRVEVVPCPAAPSLSWCAVPAPSLFMFCRTLRRNLVQILFDILRWPGDIHCLLCFLWIPLFWFLSSHFRPPSLSLACWVSVARKETAFNARRVCQHLQPVCHLHCHLGIVAPSSPPSP